MQKAYFFLILCAFIVFGCKKSEEIDETIILARVNGQPIYKVDLRGTNLEDAINTELLYQQALRRGFGKDREKNNVDISVKREIIRSFKKDLDKNIEITGEEKTAYYNKNIGDYEVITLKELVFSTKHLAMEASDKIKSGEDVEKIMTEYSTDPAKASLAIKIDPAYREFFVGKDIGTVSDIIEDSGNYKIAVLIEKHQIPLSSVSKSIESKLKREKREVILNDLLANLKKKSKIQKFSK